MPSIDEQMAVQAVLAPSPALPLSLQWVKQRDQVVNHMSPPDITHRGSVSDTSKPVSWHALCPALYLPKAPPPQSPNPTPYFLCKAEGCHRSKVLLLMEHLLIFQSKPRCSYTTNHSNSMVAGRRSRALHSHVSRDDGILTVYFWPDWAVLSHGFAPSSVLLKSHYMTVKHVLITSIASLYNYKNRQPITGRDLFHFFWVCFLHQRYI